MIEEATYPKKTVIEWLNSVDYAEDLCYIPSAFALEFVNFIKLVNGEQGEEHATPVTHLRMLDNVHGPDQKILNMCSRGLAKTTIMAEYLFLYLAVYGEIPDFGKINLALYVSDSIENGVKNMRKNLEYRWENSAFLQRYIPNIQFTDIRWEFINIDRKRFIVKGYGARALSLDSPLYTDSGQITIGMSKIGDKIYGPNGQLTTIINKSEVFHKPMYELLLEDGRKLKVSEDHINSVIINTNPNNTIRWEDKNLTTKELLQQSLVHTKLGNKNHRGTSSKHLVFVRNTTPLNYTEKILPIDPYTLGLILGDGSIKKKASGITITSLEEDYLEMMVHVPYELGQPYLDKRTTAVVSWAVKGINRQIRDLNLAVHGDDKFIPNEYFIASPLQRLALLQGLMDTDGSCFGSGRMTFSTNSPKLAEDTARLIRSLGGKAHIQYLANGRPQFTVVELWMSLCPFKLSRKAKRFIPNRRNWDRVALISITPIPQEPSQCIAVDNEDHQFLSGEYFRTHNTGVRGSKELGVRPQLAVLDDLISDEDARSDTVIAAVEATVNKAVNFALHPTRSKTIWSGTPFNARDPLYKAVESGAWKVNVFPVCNQFPCTKEDFVGAWPSRFPYEYVKKQYDFSLKQGKISDFNQELMLRIMSEEDRLITAGDILWYSRSTLLANKSKFNYYITTDFATSDKQSADYSVIMVWAVNSKGFWFLVDGICKRQTMDKNVDDLFRLAQLYNPQSVGIEISGQQGGFIPWIQGQMMDRNCYFTLASSNNGNSPGIKPITNKMVRFNIVVPWFKTHQMFFPTELKETPFLLEIMNELELVSAAGFKSKNDDCLDGISMLSSLTVWRPSEVAEMIKRKDDMWDMEDNNNNECSINSYVV